MTRSDCYRAYLLRLWRVNQNGETVWRAAIENAHTNERRAFANVGELFSFLRQQTGRQETDGEPAESQGDSDSRDST